MHYERGQLIGKGGMALVYEGRYIGIHSDVPSCVALKYLKDDYCFDEEIVERFLREARICHHLQHPNIVRVYDLGRENGQPYLVMDLLRGETLRARLKRGALTQDGAAHFASQILAALEAAHAQGIVHRDIKAGNILLGEDGSVKVTDFGIARVANMIQLTIPGTQMGTAEYMSPEQIRGEEIDARSDLYSLGALLYEMLIGTPPFTGTSALQVTRLHLQQQVPVLPHHIAPQLREVVQKALQKLPSKRFNSAREMRAALQITPIVHPQVISGAPQSAAINELQTVVRSSVSASPVKVQYVPKPLATQHATAQETVAREPAARNTINPKQAPKAPPSKGAKPLPTAWVVGGFVALALLAILASSDGNGNKVEEKNTTGTNGQQVRVESKIERYNSIGSNLVENPLEDSSTAAQDNVATKPFQSPPIEASQTPTNANTQAALQSSGTQTASDEATPLLTTQNEATPSPTPKATPALRIVHENVLRPIKPGAAIIRTTLELARGRSRVVQKAREGKRKVEIFSTFRGDTLLQRDEVPGIVTKEPRSAIIEKGVAVKRRKTEALEKRSSPMIKRKRKSFAQQLTRRVRRLRSNNRRETNESLQVRRKARRRNTKPLRQVSPQPLPF